MAQIQDEIAAEFPELDIQFVGVNQSGLDYGNATFTADIDLPWLQDVDADGDGRSDAWAAWDVLPRDVVILNADNLPVATYNLTTHDIAEAENYETLKQLVIDVASADQETGTINGHVYFDVNDNGNFDQTEAPIGGVTVELSGTTRDGQIVAETTVTQTDGSFSFQGLAAGTYTIIERQPAMTLDGQDTAGELIVDVANDEFTVELGTGEDVRGLLFGERGRTGHSITLADFLASTPADGIDVMTDADAVQWYCLRGEWQEFYYAEINVAQQEENQSGDHHNEPAEAPALTLSFRNDHGHTLEAEWPSESNHLSPLARSGDQVMMRAHGELIDITQLERDAQSAEGEAEVVGAATTKPPARSDLVEWPVIVDELWTGYGDEDDWVYSV